MDAVRCDWFALGAEGTSFALAGVAGNSHSAKCGVDVLEDWNACSLGTSHLDVQGVQRNLVDFSKSEGRECTSVLRTRDSSQR